MTAPRRIQRQRAKGWRMPEGAVYVGRPTVFGNPFRVGDIRSVWLPPPGPNTDLESWPLTPCDCVALYRIFYLPRLVAPSYRLAPLRGRDLACWCPLGAPCHADVLLAAANS